MHKILLHWKRLSIHLYDDFQIRFWIENCPNIYPNAKNLSLGWITITWEQ